MKSIHKIKLISIDLDGTLLFKKRTNKIIKNDNLKISKENLESLKKIVEKGNHFNFATGRSMGNVIKYVDEVQKFLNYKIPYIICLNGSLVYDNINQKLIKHNIFHKSDFAALLKFLYQKKYIFFAQCFHYNNKKIEDLTYIKKTVIIYNFIKLNFTANKILGFKKELPENSYSKLTVILTKPNSDKLKLKLLKLFGNKFNCAVAGKYAVEIIPGGVDKLTGIKAIIQKMNLTLNQVAAIGDQDNDYLSIKHAGFGIGVDIDKKEYLKHIVDVADLIVSNDNGTAVANAINKMEERKLI